MAEHMNIKLFGLVVTKILPRGNLKITSKMLKPWLAILSEVSHLRKILHWNGPKQTIFCTQLVDRPKLIFKPTRCSPTQRSQNQLRFRKSPFESKYRKASNPILIRDLRTAVRDFLYWSWYGVVLRSTKSLTTPVPMVRERIPTVKLKIPGKAFLKSESRTSVTFTLQFVT